MSISIQYNAAGNETYVVDLCIKYVKFRATFSIRKYGDTALKRANILQHYLASEVIGRDLSKIVLMAKRKAFLKLSDELHYKGRSEYTKK